VSIAALLGKMPGVEIQFAIGDDRKRQLNPSNNLKRSDSFIFTATVTALGQSFTPSYT
jgi:hypothetical protein